MMGNPPSKLDVAIATGSALGTGDYVAAAHLPENIGDPGGQEAALAILKEVPRGTVAVAGIAVGLVFLGWMLTFFLLFLPRGYIG